MRPIHRRICWVGVERIERDLVFLDVRIVLRSAIVQVSGNLQARRQPFLRGMMRCPRYCSYFPSASGLM